MDDILQQCTLFDAFHGGCCSGYDDVVYDAVMGSSSCALGFVYLLAAGAASATRAVKVTCMIFSGVAKINLAYQLAAPIST